MSKGRGPRRRIHVEGAPQGWTTGREATAPAATPTPSAPPVGGAPRAEQAAGRALIAHNAEATQARIAGLWGRAASGREQLKALSTELLVGANEAVSTVRKASAETRAAASEQALHRHRSEVDRLTADIAASVKDLAPGAWACDLGNGSVGRVGPAPFCRIGHYIAGDSLIPALHPLFGGPGWQISADYLHAQRLIMDVVLRCVSEVPLRHLSITVFDPRLRGALGELAILRRASPSTFPPPIQDVTKFGQRLETVLADAASNAESVVAAGLGSVGEKWRVSAAPSGRIHIVIVLDWPNTMDETVLRRLSALTSVGGSTGTILLMHHAAGVKPTADAQALLDQLTPLTWSDGGWCTQYSPGDLTVQPDPTPTAAMVRQVIADSSAALTTFSGEVVRLEDAVSSDVATPWSGCADESLDAVIGEADGAPLVISLRTENPPSPNLLLGGAVGQGKSNLVLSLVYALATRYSPTELEFYLLDFKQGLEFKRFAADDDGTGWLPHVRALSLESSQEFGLAVLRHIENEMKSRSVRFKRANATRIDTFRQVSTEPMPRLVLVIDEFHVLFDGEDALVDEAVTLLERIAKQGRAYGIHVLLASQTVSGLRALAARGDAIFAQFPLRASLKNTAAESQAILSQGNSAAADLTYRGEVIVNRNFGSDPAGSNVRGLVAYADLEVFRRVQRDLWTRSHDAPPLVFVGSESAAWERTQLLALRDSGRGTTTRTIWLGRPVALTAEPYEVLITDDVDQTIAVIGPNTELARATLESAICTAAIALGAGGTVTVLDGGGESGTPWFERLTDVAAAVGTHLRVIPRDEIAETLLGRLNEDLDGSAPATGLVVALGLQRVRGMDIAAPDQIIDDDPYALPSFDEPVTPRAVLRRLATEGALAGLPVIGWWPNLRSLENDLGPAWEGVRAFVTAGLGTEDLRAICGPHVRAPQETLRLGVFDRVGSGRLEVVVPFGPLTEEHRP